MSTDAVSNAFSKQGKLFDALDAGNKLSAHLRRIYRHELITHLQPNSEILELNCGTGLDAEFLALQGHHVLATDNAPGMLEVAARKVAEGHLEDNVELKRLSFHDIDQLRPRKFDHIISNFGGLNCTARLDDVLSKLHLLLRENGKVTLVIMPKVCPWELLMAFKGKFRTAFRRFRKNGTPANVEGEEFLCYYYNPSYVIRHLQKRFDLVSLRGVYITVPPEFYAGFVERYPRMYKFLSRIDAFISSAFPFNRCCDHFMVTMKLKPHRDH